MTPEKVLDWMERLHPDLLRFLRAFRYEYDAEDVLQRVRLKLIGLAEDGSQADPPPCTRYHGDPENRDQVFRWLSSWAKNEARNVKSRALTRRETTFVDERKPGASRGRGGFREVLDAIAEEDGLPPPDEMISTLASSIPAEQVRASLHRFKEVENELDTPTGPDSGETIEADHDLWTLFTDIELDLHTADTPTEPRPRGRPVTWDDTETRRVFADYLHIRRSLRYAAKKFAHSPEEPGLVYEKRLTGLVLDLDRWLREHGPISYRAKPDRVARPAYEYTCRFLVPVWPLLSPADARRIAQASKGHQAALTVLLIAHYYGARPDQIRGVLARARRLAVSLAPSLARGASPEIRVT